MKRKARFIYTLCYQDGVDHYSQAYATKDIEIDLPDAIEGRPLQDWSLVGVEIRQTEEEG